MYFWFCSAEQSQQKPAPLNDLSFSLKHRYAYESTWLCCDKRVSSVSRLIPPSGWHTKEHTLAAWHCLSTLLKASDAVDLTRPTCSWMWSTSFACKWGICASLQIKKEKKRNSTSFQRGFISQDCEYSLEVASVAPAEVLVLEEKPLGFFLARWAKWPQNHYQKDRIAKWEKLVRRGRTIQYVR